MMSKNACEYVLHGRDDDQQCCPHSVTRKQGPPSDCCVDDLPNSPYRMRYLNHDLQPASTTYTFDIKLVTPNVTTHDGVNLDDCSKMTLDYAMIQICRSK